MICYRYTQGRTQGFRNTEVQKQSLLWGFGGMPWSKYVHFKTFGEQILDNNCFKTMSVGSSMNDLSSSNTWESGQFLCLCWTAQGHNAESWEQWAVPALPLSSPFLFLFLSSCPVPLPFQKLSFDWRNLFIFLSVSVKKVNTGSIDNLYVNVTG